MASTYEGKRLTERHRVAQIGLRAKFLRAFAADWSILDWTRIDDTAVAWARAAKALIRSWRQDSADLAVDYYQQYREIEVPLANVPVPVIEFRPADDRPTPGQDRPVTGQDQRPRSTNRGQSGSSPDGRSDRSITVNGHTYQKNADGLVKPRIDWTEFDKAVEKSLLVTGPSELKRRAANREPEEQAMQSGLVSASGAATRQVLNGGREALLTLVQADETALGWARVTDGDPCYFCAMLASRGPVYKSAATAGFKAHDHCACSAEAVFSRSADWPGDARDYQRLWYSATKGYSGKDAINAFRRAHEAQRRIALPGVALSA